MQTKRKRTQIGKKPSSRNRQPAAIQLPHRTADDSPAGDVDASRNAELRDPYNAPGQLPRRERNDDALPDADEAYGGTQIPRSHRGGKNRK